MAGLRPAIQDLDAIQSFHEGLDGRLKGGHDELGAALLGREEFRGPAFAGMTEMGWADMRNTENG
jgi:hypothetical protein